MAEEVKTWRQSTKGVLIVVCLAIFTDMLLFGMLIPIQDPFLRQFGPEYTTDGWQTTLYVMYSIGLFLSTPIFGVVSDRLQTRQVPMLVGLAALAGSTLLFALSHTISLLLVARLLQGVSAAATWVVGFAMLTDSFSGTNLAVAISTAMTFHSLGFFVGPIVGGFMSDLFGIRSPFYLCVALTVLDFFMRLLIQPPKPQAVSSDAMQVGILRLLVHPPVTLVLGVIFLYSCSFSAIEALFSKYMEHTFGFSHSLTSLSMLGFVLPSTLNSFFITWLSTRYPRYRIMTVGLLLHALMAPLPVIRPVLWILVGGSAMFAISASTMMSPASPQLISTVDRLGGASYARVYALINMTYSLGMFVGPAIVGAIKAKTSYPVGMLFITACCLLYCPLFFLLMRRCEERDRAELMQTATVGMNVEALTSEVSFNSETNLI